MVTKEEALISHFMFARRYQELGGICYAYRVHSADPFACLSESKDGHEKHLGNRMRTLGNGLGMGLNPKRTKKHRGQF